ncbi:HesA/MoeB/ThiF family protein [Neomegalonema perideroedes]|uniref:HesA/MoeB/ThiF family protein n=1 Tax=Neomegalonema perideroedes TaxID=217219 RepID=UPI00037CEB01|nr:HesA/MoeB/ThiF family protein [Neomegalonema perideroedes]
MAWTESDLERHARHLVLPDLGGPGVGRIRAAKVLILGAGGLGSPLAYYLAAAGVGRIGLCDDDHVDLSNLQRQILHFTADVGRSKLESAAEKLTALNPGVEIALHPERLTEANAEAILRGSDLLCDGTDNFETRALANRTAARLRIPLVSAAMERWSGQISVYRPWLGGPCAACVFPTPTAPGLAPDCATGGVLGPLPGVMGSLMAVEALKLLSGAGEPLDGRMLLYDGLDARMRVVGLAKRPDCPVCSGLG